MDSANMKFLISGENSIKTSRSATSTPCPPSPSHTCPKYNTSIVKSNTNKISDFRPMSSKSMYNANIVKSMSNTK